MKEPSANPVVLHPRYELGEGGTLKDTVPRRPRDNLIVGNKDLGVVARLGERFFGCHAVGVNVVAHIESLWGFIMRFGGAPMRAR
jgi:hypothetical protein